MQTLYIIRGLPGSGKTTLAKQIGEEMIAADKPYIHFEADQFFMSHGPKDEYTFDPRALGAAHDECYGRTIRYLLDGYSVAVANTFSTKREVNRYIKGVERLNTGYPKFNIQVKVIVCTDYFGSTHNIPESTFRKMRERWEDIKEETYYSIEPPAENTAPEADLDQRC